MNWRILKKISIAVIDVFKAFNHKSEPRLIMTLLVKDEEEMLEKNLIFHKSLGVDGFIVTDNNSSDATPRILQKYKDKGWILEVINEKATNMSKRNGSTE